MAWLDDSFAGLGQARSCAGQVDDSATDGWQVSVGLDDKGDRENLSFDKLAWDSSHSGDGQGSKIREKRQAPVSTLFSSIHLQHDKIG